MASKTDLTEMQKIFCAEFIKTGNAYQSALTAGYSESFAKTKSGQMVNKPKIKAYMNSLKEERTEALQDAIAGVDEILVFLSDTMRGKTGAKPSERLKSAELLGKTYAMFTDKVLQNEVKQVVFTDGGLLPEDEDDVDLLLMEGTEFLEEPKEDEDGSEE